MITANFATDELMMIKMIIFYLLNAIASVILGDALPRAALELILATHQPLSPASPFVKKILVIYQ